MSGPQLIALQGRAHQRERLGRSPDAQARALTATGEPIPGVFVAGADAGGVYTRGYTGGLVLGLAFGRLAGRHAAQHAATVESVV